MLRSIFPILTIGPILLAWLAIRANVTDNLILVATFGSVLICQRWLEKVLPYRRDWTRRATPHVRADLAWLVISVGTIAVLDVVAIAAAYEVARQLTALIGYSAWPTSWPFVLQLVLAILVADLGHYWAHRALHVVPGLWEHHQLHHAPDHMHAMNFFRMHPIDLGVRLMANVTPLIFLGVPHDVLLLWSVIAGVCAGSLAHANILLDTRGFDHWFVTPYLHRIHHAKEPPVHANFGNITTLWDRVWRTYRKP